MTGFAIPCVKLSGCQKAMPVMGMGTVSFPPADLETTKAAVLEAIKAGYRHFDTAFAYGSEKALGEAVAEAVRVGLVDSRDALFITTKLFASFAEPSQIVPACKMSLQNLEMEYVDLFLIHLPVRLTEIMRKTPVAAEIVKELDMKGVWEGMEECKNLGLAKAIGVSNFSCKRLQLLLSTAKIPPAVNQVEMNPLWQQQILRDFCNKNSIHITAYSPLGANNTKWGDNRIVESDVLAYIAKARGKTTAQVALRWAYEQGVSIVSKSFNKERMKENLQIFDWSLTDQDMQKISQLPQAKRVTLASLLGPHDLILEIDAEVYFATKWPKDKVMDESCWTDSDFCRKTNNWYCFAKTVAEAEAWDYAESNGLDLLSVCPGIVLGPMLQPTINSSSLILLQLLQEGYEEMENNDRVLVYVRDVAEAIKSLYEKPEAEGRYICTSHVIKNQDLVQMLKEIYPNYNYPKSFKEGRDVPQLSSEKLQRIGWKYTALKETLVDSVENYKQLGYC